MEHRQHQQPTTIAIFAATTIHRAVLTLLLEGEGYEVKLLEAPPAGVAVNGFLDGVDIVLLGTDHINGRREALLSALLSGMRDDPKTADIPVLTLLSPGMGEAPKDDQNGTTTVPWPSLIKTLVEHIEAALVSPAVANKGEWERGK
jgi:hypothetical protein